MKIAKSILLASATMLSLASVASATDYYVRFTGSSAFRSTLNPQILAAVQAKGTTVYGHNGTDFAGASNLIFVASMNSGADRLIVKATWTGSEAGLQSVAKNGALENGYATTTNFIADSVIATLGAPTTGLSASSLEIPDIALSDTLQATSQFSSAKGYATLTEVAGQTINTVTNVRTVGVVPFVWLASKNAATMITGSATGTPNMTSAFAKQIVTNGNVPVGFWTGVAGDHSKKVYALGRNPDSGTRLIAFAESGYGAIKGGVTQYAPVSLSTATGTNSLITGTGVTLARLNTWPTETINGISTVSDGNSGYNSGGNLAKAMASDDTGTVSVDGVNQTAGTVGMLAYISYADAASGIAAGARVCTWNGVPYSAAAVAEGTYTFWSFEHMYYRSTQANIYVAQLASTTATGSRADTTNVKIPLANVIGKVTRTVDAGLIGTGKNY